MGDPELWYYYNYYYVMTQDVIWSDKKGGRSDAFPSFQGQSTERGWGGGDGGRTQAGHHHCGYFTDLQVAAFHSLVG